MHTIELTVPTAVEMEALGARMAPRMPTLRLVYIRGPLGAGKTTWVRGVLRGLDYNESVKSPTFTLVEPYAFAGFTLYHFDLYRVNDSDELEFLGLRDYLQETNLCLIEWPERGGGLLPAPDIDVIIRPGNTGRSVQLVAHSERGEALLNGLQ